MQVMLDLHLKINVAPVNCELIFCSGEAPTLNL